MELPLHRIVCPEYRGKLLPALVGDRLERGACQILVAPGLHLGPPLAGNRQTHSDGSGHHIIQHEGGCQLAAGVLEVKGIRLDGALHLEQVIHPQGLGHCLAVIAVDFPVGEGGERFGLLVVFPVQISDPFHVALWAGRSLCILDCHLEPGVVQDLLPPVVQRALHLLL